MMNYKAVYEKKRNNARTEYHRQLSAIDRSEKSYEQDLATYRTDPLMIHNRSVLNVYINQGLDLIKDIEEIAKIEDRLFVRLIQLNYRTIELHIARNRHSERLLASLMLIAKPVDNFKFAREGNVLLLTKVRSWTFRFQGDEGEKLINAWIAHCCSDLLSRLVLGIDTPEGDESNDDNQA